jgi:hypothetical protein
MTTWTPDELTRIGAADELQIAPTRRDGSPRTPTTIWVVPHGDDFYVRAAHGQTSAWYRGTRSRREGHIRAGGVDKDVTFTDVPADDAVNDQIDAASTAPSCSTPTPACTAARPGASLPARADRPDLEAPGSNAAPPPSTYATSSTAASATPQDGSSPPPEPRGAA